MNFAEAERIFERALNPMSLGEFFEYVGKRYIKVQGSRGDALKSYLGDDPERVLLNDFDNLAAKIGCHAAAPSGPPPAIEELPDADAFAAKIAAFHTRGYTVRLPEIRSLTPELDALIRAMEVIFQIRRIYSGFHATPIGACYLGTGQAQSCSAVRTCAVHASEAQPASCLSPRHEWRPS